MVMNVIVFGHTGYIGSNIYIDLKKKGYNVLGVNKKNGNLLEKTVAELMVLIGSKPSHFIITSAITRTSGDSREHSLINIVMFHKMIDVLKRCHVKSIVYLSAADVYGNGGIKLNESACLSPVTPYGAFKVYAENLLSIEFSTLNTLTIIRIPGVFGGENDGLSLISLLIKKIEENKIITLTNKGRVFREFLSMEILLQVIESLIKNPLSETINVSCQNSFSIKGLVDLLSSLMQKKVLLCLADNKTDRDYDLTYDKTKMNSFFPMLKCATVDDGVITLLS